MTNSHTQPKTSRVLTRLFGSRVLRGPHVLIAGLSMFIAHVHADQVTSEMCPLSEALSAPAMVDHQATLKATIDHNGGKQILLEALSHSEKSIIAEQPKRFGPLKIGFDRPVMTLKETATTASQLNWHAASDGGWIGVLTIASPEAVAMRLGLLIGHMPDAAELRFFAPNTASSEVILVRGALVNHLIELNLSDPNIHPQTAHIYWSPVIQNAAIAMELYVPPPYSPKDVSFAIPQIAHLYHSPLDSDFSNKIGESQGCQVNVMCANQAWQNQGKSVARMVFKKGASSYLCSGTLLNDQDPSSCIPYFLSANHCIADQSTASTLETYWFYRASACDSNSLSPSSQHLTGGAALLYNFEDTDTSFMKLNSAVPNGVIFSGWNSSLPSIGSSVTGLHHPGGDLQKISQGKVTGYMSCVNSSDGETFTCTKANTNAADHIEVSWDTGLTEGGSSGSGLFLGDLKLIGGQLHGGSSGCNFYGYDSYNYYGSDYYGRFDKAYEQKISTWLGAPPAYTLSISNGGNGAITSNPSGINCGTGGADCNKKYTSGTSVTLTATPDPGYLFDVWNGDCFGKSINCQLQMTANKNVSAQFTRQIFYTLSVSITGEGLITSKPAGIDCGDICDGEYASNTSVTLTAKPAQGYVFNGWKGDCSGTQDCRLAIDSNKEITAEFVPVSKVDFVITGVKLEPSILLSKSNFTATFTVKNQGTESGNAGKLFVWTDQANPQSCRATSNNSSISVDTLISNQSKDVSVTLNSGAPSDKKILRGFIDGDCITQEMKEDNNQFTKTYAVNGGPPDFLITDVKISPSAPVIKSAFTATITIQNKGETKGDAGYLDVWADHRKKDLLCGALGDEWKSVGVIDAGKSISVSVPFRASPVAGQYTLLAFVDSWCETTEVNENNNQSSNQFMRAYTIKNK